MPQWKTRSLQEIPQLLDTIRRSWRLSQGGPPLCPQGLGLGAGQPCFAYTATHSPVCALWDPYKGNLLGGWMQTSPPGPGSYWTGQGVGFQAGMLSRGQVFICICICEGGGVLWGLGPCCSQSWGKGTLETSCRLLHSTCALSPVLSCYQDQAGHLHCLKPPCQPMVSASDIFLFPGIFSFQLQHKSPLAASALAVSFLPALLSVPWKLPWGKEHAWPSRMNEWPALRDQDHR